MLVVQNNGEDGPGAFSETLSARMPGEKSVHDSFSITPAHQMKRKRNPLDKLIQLDTLGTGSYGNVVKVEKKTDG